METHHHNYIEPTAGPFDIDHVDNDIHDDFFVGGGTLPNDVLFPIPPTHEGSNLPDIPAIDTAETVNIAGFGTFNTNFPAPNTPYNLGLGPEVVIDIVEPTSDVDDMEMLFDFPAASVPDNPDVLGAASGLGPYNGCENLAPSQATSMLNNVGINTTSSLTVTAHISSCNSMTADYPLGSTITSASSTPIPLQDPVLPRRRHQCTTCSRSFTRKADRDRHFVTKHTNGPRTFSCTFLGCTRVGMNGFSRRDKFNEHRAHMRS